MKKDPGKLSPEIKARLAKEILALKAASEPREWESRARTKQLPPDHPLHHQPWVHPVTGRVYRCGCSGVDDNWTKWIFLAGRGCVAGRTRIYLPLEDRHERIDILAQAGVPITVLALADGSPRAIRTGGPPFLKGVADLFEVRTDDGQVITVTDQHRFLTPQGWQRLADVHEGQLLASGAPVPPSGFSSLTGLLAGARHSSRTAGDFQDDYQRYPRSGGQLLRWVAGSARVSPPSRDGAGGRSHGDPSPGGRGSSAGYIRLRLPYSRRARSNFSLDGLSREDGAARDVIRWTRIRSITPAGTDLFYDMHVPGAENYAAEGFWNHNTGKTMAGSQWTLAMAMSEPGIYVAVCAPTFANVRATCFEDLQSGIIANAQPGEIEEYNRNNLEIKLRNGSVIRGFSAENTDSVRGQNLSYCWFDELAMIKYTRFFHYGLMPALRVRPENNPPRVMITTTPSSLRLIRDLVEQAETDPKIHITTAVSEENPFFAEDALADLRRQYKGTYLEQQELEGKLILGTDGALFTIENFCEYRVHPKDIPDFRRIVVAIDPATTSSDTSDESGIVVAGESDDHHFYTLEDCSLRGTPAQVMRTVAAAFHRWEADLVVGENTIGDYMPELLSKEDVNIPYKSVAAMKGKIIRAESVSHLAMNGRVHMVGSDFDLLEKQLSAMTPDLDRKRMHDDRADAWVWAMLELSRRSSGNFKEMYGFFPCPQCGKDVNQTLDRQCRNCGHEVVKQQKEKIRDRGTRWAGAYRKTCMKGHEYPMRLEKCPECEPDPSAYLRKVSGFSGMAVPGIPSYNGGNWFQRRKI